MSPRFLAGFTAVLVAACAQQPAQPPAPSTPQSVTITRDRYGVPHIVSDSEEAGFYGLGYAQAQDRLPQLLGGMLWAQGRYAEIMGDGLLASDIENRRWRTWNEGQTGFARLSPQLQRNYRAFVAGANRFIAENPKRVPKWAPPLTPEGFVAVSRGLYWAGYNAAQGPAECAKSGAKPPVANLDATASALKASNEWAVLPSRTANGETMLLADPHVETNNPFYYEYVLDAGKLHSAGFAVGPLLWQAQNRHVAWALTTGNPDLSDCYLVDTVPGEPRSFLFDGKPAAMEVIHETFRSASGKTVERDFEYTRHNGVLSAVVSRDGDKAYVVSQSQMHDGGLFDDEIHRMHFAGNVGELREAMKTLGMLPQNVMAIDSGGHAWYVRAGKTPRRPPGHDWTRAVPGNTSATAWLGTYALDDMVQLSDPAAGYMTNNNVAPDRMVHEGNLDASKYSADLFADTPGRVTTRGMRALEVLSQARAFSVDDAMQLAFDEKWVTAEPWQRALRHAAKHQRKALAKRSPDARTLVDNIIAFDGFARAESIGALNFWFFREEAARMLEREEFAAQRSFPWTDAHFTPAFDKGLIAVAEAASKAQVAAVGAIDAPLGKLFRAGHGGKTWPLGGASIKPTATDDCLWIYGPHCDRTQRAFGFGTANKAGERIAIRGSQAMRLVVFGREPRTYTLYAFGQQSATGLPHSDDQAEMFSRRAFKQVEFDHDAVLEDAESTITLQLTPTAQIAAP